ncbi:MAG: hypothetical protein WKF65_10550 [Gaiellaceae bacterium]
MAIAERAIAQTCGEAEPGTATPPRATLALNVGDSELTKAFGKSTDPDDLSMFFKVSGCELPKIPANPRLQPVAIKGARNIRRDTLEVTAATSQGDQLVVSISAKPDTFDPGTYKSLVLVGGDYFKPTSVTVEISRSEDREWLIVLIGVGIGVGAFLLVTGGAWVTQQLGLSGFRLAAAGALVTITAVIAAVGNYWPQNVWSFDANILGLVIAAGAAATSSSIAGHITRKSDGR